MTETKIKYAAEEILEIFKEQHRLCSPLDPEAEPWTEISADMTIKEWRYANDLLKWKELSEFLNQEFRIEVSTENWYDVLEPAKRRKLGDLCLFLSRHAEKDTYEPRTLLGAPCLKAGVFLTIKKNLNNKGVDVSELRPSSSVVAYMNEYFSPMLEEITLTGTKPINKIEIRSKDKGFWNAINIFKPSQYDIQIGEIKTFRDLTERIIEEKSESVSKDSGV